ncbi:nitroreductase/quinone reductase family protein [Micromonospora sp. NPDC049460]
MSSARRPPGPRTWSTMAAVWPSYDECQARTGRDIPVVVLDRV